MSESLVVLLLLRLLPAVVVLLRLLPAVVVVVPREVEYDDDDDDATGNATVLRGKLSVE